MPSRLEPLKRARLVVGLVLAFLVWTLQPALQVGPHRHSGGDAPHVHLDAVPTTRAVQAASDEDAHAPGRGPGIARAGDANLHCHPVSPLHNAWFQTPIVCPRADELTWLFAAASLRAPSGRNLGGKARSPPARLG